MKTKELFDEALREHKKVIDGIEAFYPVIEAIASQMSEILQGGNKIMLCGNGGSAADAQHIATEFIVRFRGDFNRRSLPAIALTTDTSLLTACANDYGFDEVFKRQVEGLGNEGDLLIGISTSGNSPNVYKALEFANTQNIQTVLLAGRDGGTIAAIAKYSIIIPHKDTARIQEAHITIGHILCRLTEELIF
ncbi:MAG: D-sedoheptulose 7-phosphate isomerase [Candidatus Cloacimonetes bacterium]|nr:D-sedoheptulose 7-phosphate isomerase [Candidatus Cloacimonadota bacterium]